MECMRAVEAIKALGFQCQPPDTCIICRTLVLRCKESLTQIFGEDKREDMNEETKKQNITLFANIR